MRRSIAVRLILGVFVSLALACGNDPTPSRPPPDNAPTQFAASPFRNRITLSWTNVDGADRYNVYWSTTAGVTRQTGNRLADVTSPYTHAGLINGTTYFYVVTAENAGGESAVSTEVSATPVNSRPVAAAGADQIVSTGVTVALNASGSTDADGDVLEYSWTQVSGAAVVLSDVTKAQPTFKAPHFFRTFKFALVVSDGEAGSLPDTVTVTVNRFTQFAIASDVANANSNTTNPGKLAIAADGDRFLVVFCRSIGSAPGLVGVVVGADASVSPAFPISSYNCEGPWPSIASDGSGFLVVFHRDVGIVAVKLERAGTSFTVSGESVISSGTSNQLPAVAFDGTNYLVVWNKFNAFPNGHDIYGARVTPQGQALGEFPIFLHNGEQGFASIAFDGTNYLVVWRDTRSGSGPSEDTDVVGTRVAPDETVLDPTGIAISTAPNFQGEPHLTFAGGNYFAVWLDARRAPPATQPHLDIFGTRITAAGTLLDGPATTGGIAIVTANVDPISYASSAFDGTNYFCVFSVVAFYDPAGVYFARVSTDGGLVDGPPTQLGHSLSGLPSFASRLVYPAIASNGVRSLLAWVDNTELSGAAKDIIGIIIEP